MDRSRRKHRPILRDLLYTGFSGTSPDMLSPLRRDALTTAANPDSRHDYLVELRGDLTDGVVLRIRYIPDRLVLTPDGMAIWMPQLGEQNGPLEAMALSALDDLNNELVPRWVEVAVERQYPLFQRVVVEDRQPDWDNPALFAIRS